MMKRTSIFFITAWAILIGFNSCKQDKLSNPYETTGTSVVNDNPNLDNLPEGSFAWLHEKVFKPTCANSGCHDGTFEPEFRSINSAYNSLVNHPVVSNTPDGDYSVRVKPYDPDSSFLLTRLTELVDNTQGIMPLSTEPDSDWPEHEAYYIEKIREWIEDGAKDIYGNNAPSATADSPPTVYGLVVFPHNNTSDPYEREADPLYGIGAIEVPSDLVDVWIYPYDDHAWPSSFESITLLASQNSMDFAGALQAPFSVNPSVYATLFDSGSPVPFVYKATLDLSNASPGQYYYLRNYLDDGVQPFLTEIPNNSSSPFWFLVFSLKVVS